jgi:hypothetical protein
MNPSSLLHQELLPQLAVQLVARPTARFYQRDFSCCTLCFPVRIQRFVDPLLIQRFVDPMLVPHR